MQDLKKYNKNIVLNKEDLYNVPWVITIKNNSNIMTKQKLYMLLNKQKAKKIKVVSIKFF